MVDQPLPSPMRSGAIDRVALEEPGRPRREFLLGSRDLHFIGRSPDRDIPVEADEQVAPTHGVLHFDRAARQWVYRDLADRTFRAQCRLTAAPVHAGDVLLLGSRTKLEFLEVTPATGARASPPVVEFTSEAGAELREATRRASRSAKTVVLIGPSGSGKTSVAAEIHEQSLKCAHSFVRGKFVALNSGRLPLDQTRIADVFFGHVRGAFSGAARSKAGVLASVENGTLFFDEVESMPREAQDFLIDILDTREENRTYERLGAEGEESLPIPRFRTIFASKVPLSQSGLRLDLMYRMLDGMQIVMPPLQDRREDIPTFISIFCRDHDLAKGRTVTVTEKASQALNSYPWPGHVRELRSIVHGLLEDALDRAQDALAPLIITEAEVLARLATRQRALGVAPPAAPSVTSAVRRRRGPPTAEALKEALSRCDYNIEHTSAALCVSRTTLKSWLKRYDLSVQKLRSAR